jgi:hypothetical protein
MHCLSIMKHIILILMIAVLFIGTPLTVYAQKPGGSESGFSGSLQGGVYILQTDSQLYAEDTNRHTNDLDGPADTDGEIEGLASISLRYQFEGGTAVYAGNPLEVGEDFSLAAGVSQPIGNSTLDVAVTWTPTSNVWKNPYQTGSDRVKTDAETRGLRFQLQEIAGSPWEAIYNINRIDIEDDEIGDLENDLKRDGYTHELGVKYNLPLQQGVILRPEVSYTYGDIEGRSNRGHGINIGVLLKRVQPPWVLIGLVSGFHAQYQQTHPLFDKTRQESGMSTFAQVMRLNLFGVERLFARFAAGYSWSDANIDFFDSQDVMGLASVGINF